MRSRRPPLKLDTHALVRRIARGDARAEDELVRLFERDVLSLLRSRTSDREVVRELANDVMIGVICALRVGRLQDPDKLQAFIRGTVRNVINNHFRARYARPFEEPLDWDIEASASADALEEDERLAVMRRGLAALTCGDREILLLTLVKGLTPRQIARDLGLTPQVVRARKSRALQRLISFTRGSDS